jgi:hypothetical protein
MADAKLLAMEEIPLIKNLIVIQIFSLSSVTYLKLLPHCQT